MVAILFADAKDSTLCPNWNWKTVISATFCKPDVAPAQRKYLEQKKAIDRSPQAQEE